MQRNLRGLTVDELFRGASLTPVGPVRWEDLIPEAGPGVYAISVVAGATDTCERVDVSTLSPAQRDRWLPRHPIIYIGRAGSLSDRLHQFYTHRYGDHAPHRGGQDVLLLGHLQRWVFWSPTLRFQAAEHDLIHAFVEHSGHLPFANRRF